jgi:hypothetical protein
MNFGQKSFRMSQSGHDFQRRVSKANQINFQNHECPVKISLQNLVIILQNQKAPLVFANSSRHALLREDTTGNELVA